MIINPISYPGNKAKIIKQIIPLIPKQEQLFVDVFAGSGIVGVNSNKNTIILNDISTEAINLLKYFYDQSFEEIMTSVEKLINEYGLTYSRTKEKGFYIEHKHEGLSNYNRDGYNKLKNDYNVYPTLDKLFLLLIYGFNHYIRFNSKGEFNVPVGKVDFSKSIYKNAEEFINGIKKLNIIFSNLDFRDKSLYQYENAIYYFDPPYLVTTAPYNMFWTEKDEYDLLSILDDLNSQGKKFMLSNVLLSNGKENAILKEWSKKYNVVHIKRQYLNANYQKKNITETIEVIIKNF